MSSLENIKKYASLNRLLMQRSSPTMKTSGNVDEVILEKLLKQDLEKRKRNRGVSKDRSKNILAWLTALAGIMTAYTKIKNSSLEAKNKQLQARVETVETQAQAAKEAQTMKLNSENKEEVQAQLAEARVREVDEQAQTRVREAVTRAEARVREMDEQAQTRVREAVTRAEARVTRAEEETKKALTRAQLAEAKTQQAEAKTQQAEAEARVAKTQQAEAEKEKENAMEVENKELEEAVNKAKTLTQELGQAKKELAQAEAQAKTQLEKAEAQLEEAEAQLEEAEAQLKEAEVEKNKLNAKLITVNGNNAAGQVALQDIKENLAKKQLLLKSKENEVVLLNTQLADFITKSDLEKKKHKKELNSQLLRINSLLNDDAVVVNAINKTFVGLYNNVFSNGSSKDYTTAMEAFDNKPALTAKVLIETIEKLGKIIENYVQFLKTSHSATQKELKTCNSKLKTCDDNLTESKRQLTACRGNLVNKISELETCKEEKKELQDSVNLWKTTIASLKHLLSQKETARGKKQRIEIGKRSHKKSNLDAKNQDGVK
jgi:chromosome segregation ATPase